mgnify:CR=1 FL=1
MLQFLLLLEKFLACATELCGEPKEVSNLIMGELMRLMSETSTLAEDLTMEPKKIADLIGLLRAIRLIEVLLKKYLKKCSRIMLSL